ncbi:MAG: GNAT family N-acetyltransferase [Desulfobacterium sp.]|nr:GNAT family N-acetyltransferase [Desulfobacteraceae bacterium]MBA3036188.1 GNAT family N-acetyltransferase [Desulfobacterium sp.]
MKRFDYKHNNFIDLTSIRIEGDRVVLSSICGRYSNEVFKEFTPEITVYMVPKPTETIDETVSFIAESLKSMKAGNDLHLVITKKDNGEFLGCCGLHGRQNTKTPELGIWIKKAAHGNKYGQEAIQTLVSWAIGKINFDYFIYPVDKANIASRKIPETLGGIIFEEKMVSTMRGTILDEIVYKIKY